MPPCGLFPLQNGIIANPEYEFNARTPIWKIDEALHKERINRGGAKLTHVEDIRGLPNGSFIMQNGQPGLCSEGMLFRWTAFGYEDGIPLPQSGAVEVLTPRSVVAAFRAGYKPQIALGALQPR